MLCFRWQKWTSPQLFIKARNRIIKWRLLVRCKLLSISNSIKMINSIKNILGFGPKVDFADLVKQGATILDVRSIGEYQGGHIKGSINISVDTLSSNLNKLQKNKPIITCCASGMRSDSAKSILQSNGFTEVHNGGAWSSLNSKIR